LTPRCGGCLSDVRHATARCAYADHIATTISIPVTVHLIGERGGLWDPCGDWASRSEIDTTGAVLVRPDGHVVWRCPPPPDPTPNNNSPTPSTKH
jgi:hypothetical protein